MDYGEEGVEITAIDDKRQITAVFACSLTGKFLPMQLIYKGIISCCLPEKGQCTEDIITLLQCVLVPANTTDKLQPLDLSINKPAKDYMKQKFHGNVICKAIRR